MFAINFNMNIVVLSLCLLIYSCSVINPQQILQYHYLWYL